MEKIKGIIFDVDGVIFDTERISAQFWDKTMKKYGYSMDIKTYAGVMGRDRQGIISGLSEAYGNNPKLDFAVLSEEKTAAMVESLDSGRIPVKEGVFEVLDYLKKNGYRIAVATSTRKERAKKRLEKEHVYEHIDAFMYGDEVERSKPNPEIFLKAAEKIGLEPEQCLVIEDSPAGIEAAKRGGFRCINIIDLKEPTEEMIKNTVARYRSLNDLISWLEENNK